MPTDAPVASSPEALDDLVRTTTTRGWIALAAATAVVVVAVIWSFTATIPSQTNAIAVVFDPDATYRIVAGGSGTVEMAVSSGETIAVGQTIGTLTPFGSDSGSPASPRAVVAPVGGVVSGIAVEPGEPVDASTVLAVVNRPPADPTSVPLVAFLPAADAVHYRREQTVMVTLSDLATTDTVVLSASVVSVSNVPAELASMQLALQDSGLAEQLLRDAGGVLYRVDLQLGGIDTLDPINRPVSGQLVELTNTYAEQRPVELLFGSDG